MPDGRGRGRGRGEPRGLARRERRGVPRRRPWVWPADVEEFFGHAMRPRFGWRFPRRGLWGEEAWFPEVDVFERKGNIVVRADLPGVAREDIDVSLEGDMLVIRGHREEEKEVKEEDYYSCERASGAFSRAIRVPEGTDADAIEATFQSGVLEVTVPRPRAPETKGKTINVK